MVATWHLHLPRTQSIFVPAKRSTLQHGSRFSYPSRVAGDHIDIIRTILRRAGRQLDWLASLHARIAAVCMHKRQSPTTCGMPTCKRYICAAISHTRGNAVNEWTHRGTSCVLILAAACLH